jgi:hypothetical protein
MAAVFRRAGQTIASLRFPIVAFFVSRCVLILLAYFCLALIPLNEGPGLWRAWPNNLFVDGLVRWDSDWYHGIAESGYTSPDSIAPDAQRNTAFFPLYPLLVRALNSLVGDLWGAGLIVSNLAFLFACIGLFRLAEERCGGDVARKAVQFLCYNPFSIFFVSMYAESLFLAVLVFAFLFAERERWALAGLFSLLAGATKVSGCLLPVGLLVLYIEKASLQRRRIRGDIGFLLLGVVGPGAFLLYLQLRYGDFLEFFHAQRVAGWAKGVTLGSAVETLRGLSNVPDVLSGRIPLMDISHLFLLFGFCLVVGYGLRKRVLNYGYAVWSFAVAILSLAKWNSAGRSLAVVFPAYLVLGFLSRRQLLYESLLALSVLFNGLFLTLFTHWYWVA